MPAPPSFHASPLPSNKAGSSAHCRVMNTGNMFDPHLVRTLSLSSRGEQLQNYDISRVTLTAATTCAYRSAKWTRGENFVTVTGVCSLSLSLSLFSFHIYTSNLDLVNLATVSDEKDSLATHRRHATHAKMGESICFHVVNFIFLDFDFMLNVNFYDKSSYNNRELS